jgi:hypothetical protein
MENNLLDSYDNLNNRNNLKNLQINITEYDNINQDKSKT